jgi:hypothetical protein|tara:strand:+ start:4472 stop:4882 length:411 start_codon:yes stop_codon:yes gene_type:complete
MKIPILIADETAPDRDTEFKKLFEAHMGITVQQFKEAACETHTDDDDWVGYRLGVYRLECYCDAQYWHLFMEANDDRSLILSTHDDAGRESWTVHERYPQAISMYHDTVGSGCRFAVLSLVIKSTDFTPFYQRDGE